ncbi:MAG: gamma-glutamyl-gamma-aminobutyrate hydrolase family protein [Chloroherpetonaceae bacterium]|nr:gamma-glutamyl-gamma-aminobutyrate hydrolase family protein [Chloroherpetonaceae bacterium]MDW8436669.1 gamma-glutamyl-gamma-aminobutyrate hydrolase family protein [Chloroherpetonaceae bacterium]
MKLVIGVTEYLHEGTSPYATKTDEYVAWLKSGEEFGYDIDCVKLPYEANGKTLDQLRAENLDWLARLDAIVFSGGQDVKPSFFGKTLSDDELEKFRVRSLPERDEMEIWLAQKSIERELPILGICRGLQLVNVAMGGTLILDIERQTGAKGHETEKHNRERGLSNTHPLTINLDSKIGKMIGEARAEVSTRHHQAAEKVAKGLRIVAKSDDGIIEALEADDDRPIYLVQWHPERMWIEGKDNAFSRHLLKGFLDAVAARKRATQAQSV